VGERKKAVMNDVDSLMSALVSYNRRPGDVPGEVSETFSEIVEILGKSTRTRGIHFIKIATG
jgi:hypothetical protein